MSSQDKRLFYVMGGEYTDVTFETLITRTNEIHGPYETRALAEIQWRELSFKQTEQTLVKYEIIEVMHKIPMNRVSGMIFQSGEE
jgi:hypothetical protein